MSRLGNGKKIEPRQIMVDPGSTNYKHILVLYKIIKYTIVVTEKNRNLGCKRSENFFVSVGNRIK